MGQKLTFKIAMAFILIGISPIASAFDEGSFQSSVQRVVRDLNLFIEENKKQSDTLSDSILNLQNEYSNLHQSGFSIEQLYIAQHKIRFINSLITDKMNQLYVMKKISLRTKNSFEYQTFTINDLKNDFYLSPQKGLPIEGVRGSDWPLSRWENDPEFYNYEFKGDAVIYRGLQLKAGDVILNHPIEKPVGIFTAIAEQRSLFSHAAIVAILNTKIGKLPIVVDIHERGVRAVPLHHFLGPKVLGYGEIYRWGKQPIDFQFQVENAVRTLMSVPHPYDLSGSQDRKALSCVEMISYIFELMKLQPIPIKNQIESRIYKNLLRFGKLESPIQQMPNDILWDERFEYVGYFDNSVGLRDQIINEIMLDQFRTNMENKIVKSKKDLSRIFGEVAIDQIRNKYSLFGMFILKAKGFDRENFPVGDRGILSAVNAIDNIFGKAMQTCLKYKKKKSISVHHINSSVEAQKRSQLSLLYWNSQGVIDDGKDVSTIYEMGSNKSRCYDIFSEITHINLEINEYSIKNLKAETHYVNIIKPLLKDYDEMFE